MEKILFKVKEIAEMIGMHRSTIDRAIYSGRLASVKIGGCRRVTKEALDAWISGGA